MSWFNDKFFAEAFVEIFRDDCAARYRRLPFRYYQDWNRAGEVEDQKFLSPLPHPLPDLSNFHAVFA